MAKYINKPPTEIDGFKIPDWWECQWRRVPCQRQNCTFCGRLAALGRAMGNDDIEAAEQASSALHYQAKDDGIPEEYLYGVDIEEDDFDEEGWLKLEDELDKAIENSIIYRLVERWSRPLVHFLSKAEENKESWVDSEEVEDLIWYSLMLPRKVYRQLSTRWEVSHASGELRKIVRETSSVELGYTGYAIRESISIIEKSLKELSSKKDFTQSEQFKTVLKMFMRLKPVLLDITI